MNSESIKKVHELMSTLCGLNIHMMNHKIRNTFYDNILKKCSNKKCIEVGGGSGILSLIAFKHGASHITCFEQEFYTFNVLQEVVDYCKLNDKIKLINEKFTSDSIEKHGLWDYDIIFHELFGQNLWDDIGWPIRNTFNKKIDIEITPNNLISNFYIIETDHNVANELFEKTNLPRFDPGIEIDDRFVSFYNYCIDEFDSNKNPTRCSFKLLELKRVTNLIDKKSIKKYHTHCFDLNNDNYDETVIKIKLPKLDNPYFFLPIYSVSDGEFSMKMDEAIGGNPEVFFISCSSEDVFFELNMLNGMIKIDNIVASHGVPIWY